MQHVKDGVAELRIVEVPSDRKGDQMATLSKDPGMRKIIINTPPSVPINPTPTTKSDAEGEQEEDTSATATAPPPRITDASSVKPVIGMKILHGSAIGGRGVESVKGHQGVSRLAVQEGLWENKRGKKVDGGERRKAEVRAKRRIQERKMAR